MDGLMCERENKGVWVRFVRSRLDLSVLWFYTFPRYLRVTTEYLALFTLNNGECGALPIALLMKSLRCEAVLTPTHYSLQTKLSFECLPNHNHPLIFRARVLFWVFLNVLLERCWLGHHESVRQFMHSWCRFLCFMLFLLFFLTFDFFESRQEKQFTS